MKRRTNDHKSTDVLALMAPISRCRESNICTIFTSLIRRRRRAKRQRRSIIGLMMRAARTLVSINQTVMIAMSKRFQPDLAKLKPSAKTFSSTSITKRLPKASSSTSRKDSTWENARGWAGEPANIMVWPVSMPRACTSMAMVTVLRRMSTAKKDSNQALSTITSNCALATQGSPEALVRHPVSALVGSRLVSRRLSQNWARPKPLCIL
mmetsp:Transcript_18745/g.41087  ORF Transcript_18745/g.41087 Transcript_18745/m.41087 type:complete len:209 (-) Transcript_18745:500-1126(-)